MDEDTADPGRHGVGLWGAEVDIEYHNCDADAERVEDHGEEDKLAEERHNQRGGGDDLGQQQEEHSEGEQDGDGKRNLFKDCINIFLVHYF